MTRSVLGEGSVKVLLMIPQQDQISNAVEALNKAGILNLVYGCNGNENIAVGIDDVNMAQEVLSGKGLGMFRRAQVKTYPFKIKPIYGISDTIKLAAHRLTCYGIPCWIKSDLLLCVKEEDKTEAEKCLSTFRLTFEAFG